MNLLKNKRAASGFGFEGLYNFEDAYFNSCEKISCPLKKSCAKRFNKRESINCEYPFADGSPRVKIHKWKKKLFYPKASYSRHNLTPDAFLDALVANVAGTSTPTLEATKAVFTSRYDPPGYNTEITGGGSDVDDHQVGSDVTISNSVSGFDITVTIALSTSQCNGLDTTIKASPTPTTTTFELNSVSGLDISGGDMIWVYSAGYGRQPRKVASVVGDLVTITEALPVAPVGAEVVQQPLSNLYVATAADLVVSALPYGVFKSSSSARNITATLNAIRS